MAVINQVITDNYSLWNADCMEVMGELPSASVDYAIYSPPFPELYAYSNDPRDMSNCTTYQEGMDQYRFIVAEKLRLLKPGRLTSVHCMDLKKGQYSQRDFPGDIVRIHEEAGFHFVSRVTIWKDPWDMARRTRMRSLMHKTIVNDSSKARPAGGDYVVTFQKPGENMEPITHAQGFRDYAGERQIPEELERFRKYKGDQRKNLLSHWIWRQYASPVWMDIRPGRLLPYESARETEEEKHVCPLQLDVIERCLALWSNPSDVVLTPFLGAGSEAYTAVMQGRRALGIELKETYYRQAVANLSNAKPPAERDEQQTLSLFDDVPELDIRKAAEWGALVGPVAEVVDE